MRTIRTPENCAAFLETLIASGGNVTKACEQAGVGRTAIYDWRNEDTDFAAAFEEAMQRGIDVLEDEATRRAHDGVLEPVFYQGEQCGDVRKYSDTLMIFLLKGRRPEKYKERTELAGPGGSPVVVQVVNYGNQPAT